MFAQKSLAINVELEELSNGEFLYFRDLILRLSGISLSSKKLDLVRSRLRPHIQSLGFPSFGSYRAHLESLAMGNPEFQRFVNLLTTNKTSFFREPEHFDYLSENLIPQWRRAARSKVKVWCCATSTGEEPYSLAMTLQQYMPENVQYEILATDIDTDVLAKAKNGVYSAAQSPDIPEDFLKQFVDYGKGSAEGWIRMKDEIHKHIEFGRHNLISDQMQAQEKFDLIFCRNVLIYFSKETVAELMFKLHGCLKDDGCLVIGHSESILESGSLFKTVFPSVFKKI